MRSLLMQLGNDLIGHESDHTSSRVGEVIDTVVIGAGHAGLALSCYLLRNGTEHVVLERGQVGERWRTERWDSLFFQFPNWSLQLPDYAYQGPDPDGYASKNEFIQVAGRVHRMAAPYLISLRTRKTY
jgi:putative flavoprotein involved in K+ transport